MMTTGYDCPDLLNLALMRPIFSPSEFVQIKGRGTRKHNFLQQLFDADIKAGVAAPEKTQYKLFDFFANCEYFEEKFDYDEVLHLPRIGSDAGGGSPLPPITEYSNSGGDNLHHFAEQQVGAEGMKIDRMFFEKFADKVKEDALLKQQVEAEQWDQAVEHVTKELFDKPQEYFNLEKLRRAAGVDRRITLREILEKAFGRIDRFKSKDELLDDEFEKFVLDYKPDDAAHIVPMKYFFKAYITDGILRTIIEEKRLTDLNVNPTFGIKDYKAVPQQWRDRIPEYVKDYVPINRFM
jgi:type I restriction enzyme R subunit